MGKRKILIVEDDWLIQLVYKGILSKIYDISISSDDKGFDIAISKETYDLFIIDLALNSKKSGIDLLEELRSMNKYKDTPIIVVTAFAFKKDREIALAAGASSFMVKPFITKNLIEEIAKYL
ncbi:hypothetical protein APF79_02585 [bacterium BRH_c32]|nr:MAG: hypothetical protein APF79_02585 [bacterium BRH_c32]